LKRLFLGVSRIIAFFNASIILILLLLAAEEHSGADNDENCGNSNHDTDDSTSSERGLSVWLAAGGFVILVDLGGVRSNSVGVAGGAGEFSWFVELDKVGE